MRILVTGGRTYTDVRAIYDRLDEMKPDFVVVGDADGADDITRTWCERTRTDHAVHYAKWGTFGVEGRGDPAGPKRNELMRDQHQPIDCVVAFPGGTGTLNMIELAQDAGIPVIDGETGERIWS